MIPIIPWIVRYIIRKARFEFYEGIQCILTNSILMFLFLLMISSILWHLLESNGKRWKNMDFGMK